MKGIVVIGCGASTGLRAAVMAACDDVEYTSDIDCMREKAYELNNSALEFHTPTMLDYQAPNNPAYRQIEFKGKHRSSKRKF